MKSTADPRALHTAAPSTEDSAVWAKSDFFTVDVPGKSALADMPETADIFGDDGVTIPPRRVPGRDSLYYIPYGPDDRLPYHLMRTIGSDLVLSQNLQFNILTLYGSGLRYVDRSTGLPTDDPEISRFALRNSLTKFFLEQSTDIKHFFFSVAVLILNREGTRIVKVRHKEACFCRFEQADGHGCVKHVFCANWRKADGLRREDVEMITLLDEHDPLGDLERLMGMAPGDDGIARPAVKQRKFAVVMRMPTPGKRYYPDPYYLSIFRGDWFDIQKLIGAGKKAKIRNSGSVKYHVEVHRDYWQLLFASEHIYDPAAQELRKKKELENIRNFIMGSRNAGKVWVSSYYVDSYGKEQRMVRINVVDTGKEGGDWSEDIQETSNMICYGLNIHPNLVGATPGKSQSNNSGSDKRELFTLKQSLETAFRDVLMEVHHVIIHFNGWADKVKPSVPLVLLTTLDKKTDAKQVDESGKESDA